MAMASAGRSRHVVYGASGHPVEAAMRIVECATPEQREDVRQASALQAFEHGQLRSHRTDLHLCALGSGGEARAYCSLWWKQTPEDRGHSIGAIGHFAAVDEGAAAALLHHALARLRANGCTLAVG